MDRSRVIKLISNEILRKDAIIKFLELEGSDFAKYHRDVLEALSIVLENYKRMEGN